MRSSSIFLGRIVGVMFLRVNATCAHQVRPPPGQGERTSGLLGCYQWTDEKLLDERCRTKADITDVR